MKQLLIFIFCCIPFIGYSQSDVPDTLWADLETYFKYDNVKEDYIVQDEWSSEEKLLFYDDKLILVERSRGFKFKENYINADNHKDYYRYIDPYTKETIIVHFHTAKDESLWVLITCPEQYKHYYRLREN